MVQHRGQIAAQGLYKNGKYATISPIANFMFLYHDLENAREPFLKARLELLNQGEGELDKYHFLEDPKIREQYEKQRPAIVQILKNTDFFHGTGAKHYKNTGDQEDKDKGKYAGTTNEVNDSLGSFLTKGLNPQWDLFNGAWTGVDKTISFTKLHVYARIYASLYLNENEYLGYEYGSRAFWWNLLLTRMAVHGVADFVKANAVKTYKKLKGDREVIESKIELHKNAEVWTRGFRKDDKYAGGIGASKAMKKAKSDIAGNFPLIIGFNKEGLNILPIKYRAVEMYELRTDSNIPPRKFTHIQVPLSKVSQVQARVRELGLQIPVIPIEFVELINSDTPIQELTRAHTKHT